MRLTAVLLSVVMLGCSTAKASYISQSPVEEVAPSAPVAKAEVEATFVPSAVLGPITGEGVADFVALLSAAYLTGLPEIQVNIDSPGGSVGIGLEIVDMMRAVQAGGTKIVCRIEDRGMAASMAAYIFEGCDVRQMGRQSALMFHTISISGAEGNAWDIERLAKLMKSVNDRMAIFVAGRMCNISMAEYRRNVEDRDWWLGAEEARAICAAD